MEAHNENREPAHTDDLLLQWSQTTADIHTSSYLPHSPDGNDDQYGSEDGVDGTSNSSEGINLTVERNDAISPQYSGGQKYVNTDGITPSRLVDQVPVRRIVNSNAQRTGERHGMQSPPPPAPNSGYPNFYSQAWGGLAMRSSPTPPFENGHFFYTQAGDQGNMQPPPEQTNDIVQNSNPNNPSAPDSINQDLALKPSSSVKGEGKTKKTRSRPGRPAKNEQAKDWSDQGVNALIEFWQPRESLYNTRHRDYFNKEKRAKLMDEIKVLMLKDGFCVTEKDISAKLVSLKSYYGAQKRIVDSSKHSGAGTDEVVESRWKFFDALLFLNDNFTPRNSSSTIANTEGSNLQNFLGAYDICEPPAKKASKQSPTKIAVNKVMSSAAAALEKLAATPTTPPPPAPLPVERSEDIVFGELVTKILTSLPEGVEKDELKMDIQSRMLQTRVRIRQKQHHT